MKSVLLKLSGEALGGEAGSGFDPAALAAFAAEVASIRERSLRLAIVVGAGNFVRGRELRDLGIPRERGDFMGMVATVLNGLALEAALEAAGVRAAVLSAFAVENVVEGYSEARVRGLHDRVVIFVGGTGNPFLTTDTAASIRAAQWGADLLLKGTKVDGVYSADPVTDPSAERFERLSYEEVLRRRLQVMDLTAITLCMENRIPIRVFNMQKEGNLARALGGEAIGTLVVADDPA